MRINEKDLPRIDANVPAGYSLLVSDRALYEKSAVRQQGGPEPTEKWPAGRWIADAYVTTEKFAATPAYQNLLKTAKDHFGSVPGCKAAINGTEVVLTYVNPATKKEQTTRMSVMVHDKIERYTVVGPNQKLDRFIADQTSYDDYLIGKLIADGSITINGKAPRDRQQILKPNDRVAIEHKADVEAMRGVTGFTVREGDIMNRKYNFWIAFDGKPTDLLGSDFDASLFEARALRLTLPQTVSAESIN